MDPTIIVMAKEPRAGYVKTRLTPPCSPEEAARLAAAALGDTLEAVSAVPARRRVLALAGRPGAWLRPGFEVIPQPRGGLDVRIAAALGAVAGPTVVIGMDTPQICPALLRCDFSARPAWIGLAADGGFWALGLADPDPALVRGVPMSVPETAARQVQRLRAAGLGPGYLPTLRDVDTWDDARAVAAAAPRTRFASAVAALAVPAVPAVPTPAAG